VRVLDGPKEGGADHEVEEAVRPLPLVELPHVPATVAVSSMSDIAYALFL
jgi:hypothetical protein